jgi:hypothetical protein
VTHCTRRRSAHQIVAAQQNLRRSAALPFASLLDPAAVEQVLRDENVSFRHRIYPPLVTLCVFLSQVLDPVGCCVKAVARLLAFRAEQGLPPCSAETGAYCQARQHLPEAALRRLTQQTGRDPLDQAENAWRWRGRNVKIVDGTTESMPDTQANQAAYPQPTNQKPGVGFPLLRLVVVFTLAVGTVLDAAMGGCHGKQTGEAALWRTLVDQVVDPGDIILADRLFGTYFDIIQVQQRGGDAIFRLHKGRKTDYRCGRKLGRYEQVVTWAKPKQRPEWMDPQTYAAMPETLEVRLLRVHVAEKGFRTKQIDLVTTLLDAAVYSRGELAALYRARWQAELDLRSLKVTLHMDVLRCKTPEMVRKEVWAHLLGYNLIRSVMADAARAHGTAPRELSFAGAWQTIEVFAPVLHGCSPERTEEVYEQLLQAIATHRVGKRPNRYEPRRRKRRHKPFLWLHTTRAEARVRLEKKRCD